MPYLDSVVGERRAALPPVPLLRTPTPSPLMRKDRGLKEAEIKNDFKTFEIKEPLRSYYHTLYLSVI